jgi:hypothetical protein
LSLPSLAGHSSSNFLFAEDAVESRKGSLPTTRRHPSFLQ